MTIFTHFLPITQISRYGSWLKSLDPQTLRDYFGFSLSKDGINHLMTKFKRDANAHQFLIAHKDHQWAGVLHIAKAKGGVEFGVTVKKEFRRQGIADLLLSEATTWAQNRGFDSLTMHCIIENQPIQRLCDKHNLASRNMYGDLDAVMRLPKPTWASLVKENIQRQANWYYFLRKNFV